MSPSLVVVHTLFVGLRAIATCMVCSPGCSLMSSFPLSRPGWKFQPGRLTNLLYFDFIGNAHVFTILPGGQLEPLVMFGDLRLSRLKVSLDGIVAPAHQVSNGSRIDIPQVQRICLCKVVSNNRIDRAAEPLRGRLRRLDAL